MHTSFHTGRGAVSGSNGFSCSLVGHSIKSNLIYTEKSFYISLQCNLPSFFLFLYVFLSPQDYEFSILQMCVYISVCACPKMIVKSLRISLALAGRELLKMSTLPFLTDLIPNSSLPFIHHCPLSPPSVCLSFILPKLAHPPLSQSSILSCLLTLT